MKSSAQLQREITTMLDPHRGLSDAHRSLARAHENAARAYRLSQEFRHNEAAYYFTAAANEFRQAARESAKRDPKQSKIAKGRAASYAALAAQARRRKDG